MKVYLYVLRDPRTNEVRYVGQTRHPENRRMAHVQTGKNGGKPEADYSARSRWLGELAKQSLEPIMEIVLRVEADDADDIETDLISYFLKRGIDLVNSRPKWCWYCGDLIGSHVVLRRPFKASVSSAINILRLHPNCALEMAADLSISAGPMVR